MLQEVVVTCRDDGDEVAIDRAFHDFWKVALRGEDHTSPGWCNLEPVGLCQWLVVRSKEWKWCLQLEILPPGLGRSGGFGLPRVPCDPGIRAILEIRATCRCWSWMPWFVLLVFIGLHSDIMIAHTSSNVSIRKSILNHSQQKPISRVPCEFPEAIIGKCSKPDISGILLDLLDCIRPGGHCGRTCRSVIGICPASRRRKIC